jgi:hypothetical protein
MGRCDGCWRLRNIVLQFRAAPWSGKDENYCSQCWARMKAIHLAKGLTEFLRDERKREGVS